MRAGDRDSSYRHQGLVCLFFCPHICTYQDMEIEGGTYCEKERKEKCGKKKGGDCAETFQAYAERAAYFYDAHYHDAGVVHDLCG